MNGQYSYYNYDYSPFIESEKSKRAYTNLIQSDPIFNAAYQVGVSQNERRNIEALYGKNLSKQQIEQLSEDRATRRANAIQGRLNAPLASQKAEQEALARADLERLNQIKEEKKYNYMSESEWRDFQKKYPGTKRGSYSNLKIISDEEAAARKLAGLKKEIGAAKLQEEARDAEAYFNKIKKAQKERSLYERLGYPQVAAKSAFDRIMGE